MAALSSALRQALAGISPRERKLLIALGGVLAAMLLLGMYYWSSSVIDEVEGERAQLVEALRMIRNERPRIRERQRQREEMLGRYRVPAPPLTSFVESAAREANVQVEAAADRPVQQLPGGRFARRSVSIRLRHVDLQSLVTFMDRIEAAPFPVAITSIRIRKRFGEQNSYDVDDMVISTYDRVERAPAGRRASAMASPMGAREQQP